MRNRRLLAWYFLVPSLIVVTGVLLPLAYLLLRAFQGELAQVQHLVLRPRNLRLLLNTISLTAGVLVFASAIAVPLAWITARTDVRGRRAMALAGVLPLAVPGYVMAYVLLATTGSHGTLAQLWDLHIPRPGGYTGSLVALSIYTFPYLFLNVRSSLLGMDPSLEETARSLGYSSTQVFFRLVLPQLRPAFYAGSLLVGLHVIGDFGVVSLMRFETFSYALYLQYAAAYDRVYAAWLALMLLGLTGITLLVEARLLRGLLFHRAGSGSVRRGSLLPLGGWKFGAYGFAAVVTSVSILLPLLTVLFWMWGSTGGNTEDIGPALMASVIASAPAAVLAAALALSMAYMSVRMPSPVSRIIERVAYLGYATPPLAFALAIIFFCLSVTPYLYQTLLVLILAYALHFVAEAIGPIRSALYQASPRIQEAARSLGLPPLRAFFRVTFPLLRRGFMVSVAFVFLSAMKELPITFLLSPTGFETLAMGVWGYANEALFSRAAPYALAIIGFSAAFVAVLLVHEQKRL